MASWVTILGEAFLTTVGEAFLIRRWRHHDTATVWHKIFLRTGGYVGWPRRISQTLRISFVSCTLMEMQLGMGII